MRLRTALALVALLTGCEGAPQHVTFDEERCLDRVAHLYRWQAETDLPSRRSKQSCGVQVRQLLLFEIERSIGVSRAMPGIPTMLAIINLGRSRRPHRDGELDRASCT